MSDLLGVSPLTHVAPLRCAVVSAVKHDYVPIAVASHPRFQIVVVTDDPNVPDCFHARNERLAAELSVPYVRDVETALRDFQADVAIVSSEAERHAELSVRALRAGLHVIQDKPLGIRRQDVQLLRETVLVTGRRFLMWNRNFLPSVIDLRDRVSRGEIGRLRAIHIDFYFAKDAGIRKGERTAEYPPMDWWSYQLEAHRDGSDGGLGRQPMGELSNEGIYPLGYMQMLTSAPVRRVFARGASHIHQLYVDNRVEDLASVTLEFADGVIGSIALGRIGLSSHSSGGEIKLRVLGDGGACVIREAAPTVGVYYQQQPNKEPRTRRVASESDFRLAENFAYAIDHDQETIMDIESSWQVFLTFEAARRSCVSGRMEEVR